MKKHAFKHIFAIADNGKRLLLCGVNKLMIMVNYFIEENQLTKQMFDLEEILAFQLENDVQIIRGEDSQYVCYINKSVYATGLTPMFSLAYGVKVFKERA